MSVYDESNIACICSDSRLPSVSDNQTTGAVALIVDRLRDLDLAKEMGTVNISEKHNLAKTEGASHSNFTFSVDCDGI